MRTFVFAIGAVVLAALLALGLRKFIETTMTVKDDEGEGRGK